MKLGESQLNSVKLDENLQNLVLNENLWNLTKFDENSQSVTKIHET